MARGIATYTNIDTTDPTNYPAGNLKDDPAGLTGTPVNVQTNSDVHQTFYRALERSGITPNTLPENVTNGYQYASALGLESWVTAGSTQGGTVPSFPTANFVMGTLVYDKFNRSGKTLHYQLTATGCTITGTPSKIYVTIANLVGSEFQINNLGITTFRQMCGWMGTDIIYSTHENPFGAGFALKKADGTNFAAGSYDLYVNITAELH